MTESVPIYCDEFCPLENDVMRSMVLNAASLTSRPEL